MTIMSDNEHAVESLVCMEHQLKIRLLEARLREMQTFKHEIEILRAEQKEMREYVVDHITALGNVVNEALAKFTTMDDMMKVMKRLALGAAPGDFTTQERNVFDVFCRMYGIIQVGAPVPLPVVPQDVPMDVPPPPLQDYPSPRLACQSPPPVKKMTLRNRRKLSRFTRS